MANSSVFIYSLFIFLIYTFYPTNSLAQCPRVEAILVDACGVEAVNEFVIIHSGGGFNTNNITVDFPMGNNQISIQNNDINTNVDNWPPGTPCGLTMGNAAAYTGCSNIIAVGPGFNVPPNSILVLQASNGSANSLYDFSGLCGSGQCIYVLSNNCTRTIGAFSNATSTGLRTTTFGFGSGCEDIVTYDCQSLNGSNGDYFLPLTNTYGSSGCVVPPSSPATNPVPATFNQIGPFCQGTNFTLPATSIEGFTGTWSPGINTNMTTTYTFIPTAGQCATSTQMTVVINVPVTPTFDPIGPFCQGQSFTLPGTSTNGISGTWSPAINNMTTTMYTFTPNVGECATSTVLTVTITANENPVFDQIGPFCQGTNFSLPTTSNNGIMGTWSPAPNPNATTTYTFTPAAGQCANTATIQVVIETAVTPTFNPVGPLCVGTDFTLPITSTNGITGTWSPAPNPNTTTTYTFTPDAGQCASTAQLTVTITDPVVPTFNQIGPFCEGANFDLPLTSTNGISGIWSPAPNLTATTTYTFTPSPGQCASTATMQVVINSSPRVSLTGGGNLCRGQCYEIGFMLTGGSGLYNLDMNLSSPPLLNVPFPAAGIASNDVLTICYQGLVPLFDPTTNTFSIPTFVSGSGTISVVGITDANTGCPGIIENPGSLTITLLPSPTANTPPDITACNEGNGTAFFNLGPQVPIILGNQTGTVRFFSDPDLTNEVFSPYLSGNATLYAVVIGSNGCPSAPVDFDLIVVNEGNVGNVRIECAPGETNCLICYDGTPQSVTINFIFPNSSSSYEVELFYTINGVSNIFIGTFPGTGGQQTFIVNGSSFFQLTSVTQDGGCPDLSDLGLPVNINLYLEPMIDPIPNISSCGPVTLPPITGVNISPNAAYYTGPGGTGQIYFPGQIVSQGLVLYVYDGIAGCFDQIQILVDVQQLTIYDEPSDVSGCNGYVLPPITGINVGSTAGYYTGVNGTGIFYPPGTLISSPITLYIFDVNNTCFDNQPSFMVNVAVGPQVFPFPDQEACEEYILPAIMGQSLTGNQAYYSLPNGAGTRYNPGDAISQSGRLYIFDGVIDCQTQESFFIRIDTIVNPGRSDTLVFCIGQDTFVNLISVLGPQAASGGVWIDTLNLGLNFNKPDSVNVISLTNTGIYHFIYEVNGGLCGLDSATASLQLILPSQAGRDSILVYCEPAPTSMNIESWLRNNTGSGVWSWESGSGPDLSDPENIDLSALSVGSHRLLFYTIPGANCPSDTAIFDIDIVLNNQAGTDVTTTLCIGSQVDLTELLVNNNAIGVFVDPANTGALSGSIVNSDLLSEGNFSFLHILPGNGFCNPDTARLTLSVSSTVSAGMDSVVVRCDIGTIDLRQLLRDASPGGVFDLVGGTPGSTLSGNNLIIAEPGIFELSYSVGDGVICPADEAFIIIDVLLPPEVEVFISLTNLCDGQNIDIEISYLYSDDVNIRWAIKDLAERDNPGQGFNVSVMELNQPSSGTLIVSTGALGLLPGVQYFVGVELIDGQFCDYQLFNETAFAFEILKNDSTFISPVVCQGESIEIMGVTFDASNTEAIFELQDVNGCDSLVIVNLTIQPEIINNYSAILCTGQELLIGGTLFNESNPSGTVVLEAASINGCDSTIIVQLSFQDASFNFINEVLCRGTSKIFNGNVYDENRLSGMETLDIPSAGGCDSVLVINLTLADPSFGAVNFNTCDPDFEVNLEGNVFNAMNPSGQYVSSQLNANGCDSIVMVDLIFLPESSADLNPVLCRGEVFTIQGVSFNEGNPSGVVRLVGQAANGCDSLVNVQLSFIDPVQSNLVLNTCDPDFNLLIGGIVFDVSNPAGSVVLSNAASNGCDSIVNVQIILLERPIGELSINTCDLSFSITVGSSTFNISNSSGVAVLTGAAANGCDSLVNVILNFEELPFLVEVGERPCPGETGSINIISFGGQPPYSISGTFGSPVSVNQLPFTLDGIPPGSYNLEILSIDQCGGVVQFTIDAEPEPLVNINSTSLGANVYNILVTSNTDLYDLNWTPAFGLSCTDCLNPTASQAGEFTLFYLYGADCEGQISILLEAENEGGYFIPNAIRPGSLSKNAWFYIDRSFDVDAIGKSLRIYDRWGDLMFEKLNFELGVYTEGWNGTYRNNAPVVPGVYVFVAEILKSDGEIVLLKGSITVIN